MSASYTNETVVVNYRDAFPKAMVKNVIVVVLCISINYINVALLQTFCKQQIFYMNPRYILFFHLVLNDMIQVTLTVILFISSYIFFQINVSVCCVLILLALFATENTPLNLACMAVECYIAICIPLRHVQICTVKRTLMLIGLIWMTSMLSVLPDLFITLAIEPLDFYNSRVFCLRETVFRNPHIIKKRDITYIVYLVIVWFIIFFTYFKILFTAKAASQDATKARNTIILHGFQVLLCMSIYAEPLLRQVLQQWFPQNYSDSLFACYILFQILPRAISPIVYGVRDKTYRKYLKRYLLCKMGP
ncbi:odorant receptor 131-2-like [Maylandia zebra]|uniref:Olfactory receptor 52E8-like n=2 Tax=Haplochromini TaxID=319058 RepID=A0A3P9D332_9CICH|nr:olfactory receptor 52E8-like [Maylandia zebra]XP_024658364.1 olfactory receptor 52E8-like [Maylandia zebra]XP_026022110.1 odorant receptor 131-2-like [Astatotilapia calliptera]